MGREIYVSCQGGRGGGNEVLNTLLRHNLCTYYKIFTYISYTVTSSLYIKIRY